MHRRSKYCPHCHSDTLKREHRSFLKRRILRVKAQYKCLDCNGHFSANDALYSRVLEMTRIPEEKEIPEKVVA